MIIVRKVQKNIKMMKLYGAEAMLGAQIEGLAYRVRKEKSTIVKMRHASVVKRLNDHFQAAHACLDDAEMKPAQCIERDANIWFMWWQGPEHYPEVVEKALQSIKTHCGMHNVIELNKENVTDYVTMPEDIAAKLQAGIISITHYSDMIRFALLSQYGGIWIDSTILLVDELPEAVYSRPFYTIHRHQAHNAYIAQARWSTYFLASGKGNPLMRYVFDFLVSYWRGHRKLIDYTILDYAIYMAYDRYAWVHEMIDDVPYNNERVRDLIRCLNQPFDEAVYQEMTKDNTIFKLSWKEQYKTEHNGCLTFWGYIVKHRI